MKRVHQRKRRKSDLWIDVEDIARRLLEIFEKRSMCQQVEDDDELVDEDEEAESESLLIGAAADLVGALCKAIGEGFSSYCDVFLPLISKYYVSRWRKSM